MLQPVTSISRKVLLCCFRLGSRVSDMCSSGHGNVLLRITVLVNSHFSSSGKLVHVNSTYLKKSPNSTSSEVSNNIHIKYPGHHIDLDEVKILDREPCWFERGVKEAIYIKVNKPTLNKDGGCYKLPGIYESILKSSVPKGTT